MSNLQVNETLRYEPDVGETANLIAKLAERLNRVEAMLEQRNTSAVVIPNATTATANTIALRDGSSGTAFAALTATTVAASSDATVGGTLGITGNTALTTASVSGTITSTKTGGASSSAFYVNATSPCFGWRASGGGTDSKFWDMPANATTLSIRAVNDAENAVTVPFLITRSGTTISSVTLAATTVAITGNQTVSGTSTVTGLLTATAGLAVPRSSGTAVFAFDATATGSAISLANNATTTPFGNSNNFGGLLWVNETTTNGGGGLFNVGAVGAVPAQGVSIIHDSTSVFSTAVGTASKINVYTVSGVLTIENKRGVTITLQVVPLIRTRTSI